MVAHEAASLDSLASLRCLTSIMQSIVPPVNKMLAREAGELEEAAWRPDSNIVLTSDWAKP